MVKEPHFTPARMLSMLGLKSDSLGRYALIPGPKERSDMIRGLLENPKKNFSFLDYEMHTGGYGGKSVPVGNGGRYAPDTAITTEILCAAGAEILVRIGSCGSLQEKIKVGDLVIVTGARRGEGTTEYYVAKNFSTVSDARVVDALEKAAKEAGVRYHLGSVFTTDALFQETPELIGDLERQGIAAIDMVTSAFLTIAQVRGKRAAAIMAVSDECLCGKFGFRDPAFVKAEEKMVDIDHLLFRLDEGRVAEAEFAAQALVRDRHDRRGALAAHLRDREKRGSHHVDRGDPLAFEVADQLRRLLEQRVGREDRAQVIAHAGLFRRPLQRADDALIGDSREILRDVISRRAFAAARAGHDDEVADLDVFLERAAAADAHEDLGAAGAEDLGRDRRVGRGAPAVADGGACAAVAAGVHLVVEKGKVFLRILEQAADHVAALLGAGDERVTAKRIGLEPEHRQHSGRRKVGFFHHRLEAFRDEFEQLSHRQDFFRGREAPVADGARREQQVGAGRLRLGEAVLRAPLGEVVIGLRHLAAPAAAGRPAAVPRHLDQFQARNRAQETPRRVVDARAPAEMARGGKGDFLRDRFSEPELAAARELVQVFDAVDDAEARQFFLRIFAPDAPAAPAGGDDGAHARAADRIDIHFL